MAFVPGRQDLTSDAIEHFLWPLLKRTAIFLLLQLNNPLMEVLGSPQTPAQHSFPKLTQSYCTFQIVETWPWPLGYPIITRSAWNTGKGLWLPLNDRLTIAKVMFGQILEYSVHSITLARETVPLGLRYVFVLFSLSTLYFTTVDWSLTTQMKQWERDVIFGWAGVCGEGGRTSSPKNACVSSLLCCEISLVGGFPLDSLAKSGFPSSHMQDSLTENAFLHIN